MRGWIVACMMTLWAAGAEAAETDVVLRNRHGSTLFEVRDTAMSLDDMEPVSERIAASLWRRTPIEHTRSLNTIMGREARGKNRLFHEKIIGARMGVVLPFGRKVDAPPAVLAQFDMRLEQRSYFLELSAGFWFPGADPTRAAVSGFVMQLGGSYYLSYTSASPYLGLGVSPRLFVGDGGFDGPGLAVNGQFGVMFLRESATRIYLEARLDQNLVGVRRTGRYAVDGAVVNSYPTELTFAAGIGF